MALNSAALYGGVRAFQDADTQERERRAFELDQQTREERLSEEREMRPRRIRAAELSLGAAEVAAERRPVLQEREDEAWEINRDVAATNLRQRKLEMDRVEKMQAWKDRMENALRGFQLTGDPQSIAEAAATTFPEYFAGGKALVGTDEEGNETISFERTGGQRPMVLRPKADATGQIISAREQIPHMVANLLGPLGQNAIDDEFKRKLALEDVKTEGRVTVAEEGTRRAIEVADRRARAEGARRTAADAATETKAKVKEKFRVRGLLNDVMKTVGTSGSFIAGYANPDDAGLRGIIQQRAEKGIDEGMDASEAVNAARDDASRIFNFAKEQAARYASALAKAKVNPRDEKALKAAALKGDTNAQGLLRLFSTIERQLGYSVSRYLLSVLPTK